MTPVRSIKNQYLGINAHLHPFWQATGTWNRFHNAQITHLMGTMRAELLPLGYVAEIEAARGGMDLESGPFPTGDFGPDEALGRLRESAET